MSNWSRASHAASRGITLSTLLLPLISACKMLTFLKKTRDDEAECRAKKYMYIEEGNNKSEANNNW